MSRVVEITRRQFLKGAGALVVAFSLPVELKAQSATTARAFGGPLPPNQLDSWLMIQRDGLVTVMTGKVELGIGVSTSLRQIVAEELDYPFERIVWIQGDTANTVDQLPTFGSQTIKGGGSQLRQAAAEAKATLLSLASARLSVPVDALSAAQGVISANAKKKISYAELVGGQQFSQEVTGKLKPKSAGDYKIVGKSVPRVDIPLKVTGDHIYVQNLCLPGVLRAGSLAELKPDPRLGAERTRLPAEYLRQRIVHRRACRGGRRRRGDHQRDSRGHSQRHLRRHGHAAARGPVYARPSQGRVILTERRVDSDRESDKGNQPARHEPPGGTMKSRKTFALVFSVLAILTSTSVIGYAQEKIRIGVPLFPTVSYPVFIAQEKGIFEKNGLKAEIIRINSEPTTYQALISGDIDATSGAPTGLVQSNLQGVAVVSLGSWDNLVSYTMATREKIDDLSQLRGKKIGINRLGGKSSLILRVMIEDAGLNSMKDVTLLQLGGSQERLAALIRGGIDAAPVDFAFEPKMKQLGFHLLIGKKTPFMNGPITVTAASLKTNRGKWARFVRAYLDATQYLTTNREGSVEVLRRAIGIEDKETIDYAYEQMRARATVDLVPPQAAVDNLIKMVSYVDKRAASFDKSKLADYSILKELGQGKPAKK